MSNISAEAPEYLTLGFSLGIREFSSSRFLAPSENENTLLSLRSGDLALDNNDEVDSIKEEQSANKLEEARLALDEAKNNYHPAATQGSSSEDFRQLANGVFQAEGCVSA